MSASPASNPKSPDVSERNKKYDRQLRLWGDHGQAALESSSVCLVNATATGTETLKSLVLAGLGSFSIIDEKVTTAEDIGNNFFLTEDCLGESRGRAACRLLRELNRDVSGEHVPSSVEQLLDTEPERLSCFTVVVVTDLTDSTLERLAEHLWQQSVPLLVCRCCGFLGTIRLQVREHAVVESHPDSAVPDLRLLEPFPSLARFLEAEAAALPSMERQRHGHTPYVVLLHAALQRWRETHGGHPPANYRERKQFRELLQLMRMRHEGSGVPLEEENFDEAERAVNTVLVSPAVPDSVASIFSSEQCDSLTAKSADFWVLARAVREFVQAEGEGRLPLRGDVPDMTADSERYIQLQNIYREEARRGAEAVLRRVQQLLESLGRPAHLITEEQVRLFCRNTHALRVIHGSRIQPELSSLTMPTNEAAALLQGPDSELAVYAVLRAADRFRAEFGSPPGAEDHQLEADVVTLKGCLTRLLSEWGVQNTVKDDYVQELCRYGGSELHTVAAFIGGCAAHEVVKLATGQYAPIDNTFVYNGITSTSSVFKL